jgi:hypothetical protein
MTSADRKQDAKEFLQRLQEHLRQALPAWQEIATAVGLSSDGGEVPAEAKRINFPEVAFLQQFIVKNIYGFLIGHMGLAPSEAKRALMAEGAEHLAEASGTPYSRDKYPFQKSIVHALEDAQVEWWEPSGGTRNACPDIALRHPCLYRVVIEGKLFRGKGVAAARRALVEGIFETSFYRGLPTLLRGKDDAADSYEYGCFLAYDASPDGQMWNAWNEINEQVRASIWNTLSTHVMVFRKKPAQ